MHKKLRYFTLTWFAASVCLLSSCSQKFYQPINAQATSETKNLYANLKRISEKGIMFGHQDDPAYGIGWKYEAGRSDVKEVVGDYPAVVGWDLGHLELGHTVNLDSVPFDQMRSFVQEIYAKGGLNTFSWHPNNPTDPAKTSWDKADSTIQQVFSDPAAMGTYNAWLDRLAVFMLSLKGPNGELVPVIFRPFHEHTGSWFWWGKDHVSPEDYKKFWRYTVDYLRSKNVNNLLYAYSTDKFKTKEEYLERYPGDDYVDVLGFDSYHIPQYDPANTFIPDTRRMVETIKQLGQEKGKVWAFTETGRETIPEQNWWTQTLLPIVQDAGLAYVLVWRNGRPDHFYAPYLGQESAENFKTFYQLPNTLFLKDVATENIYRKPPTK
ncbi:glycoside hydrolase family 26 protein [Pontibacter harenae]|uniref:glycoside hydrolase family 26 protein n=1 Tax=Pontibacter harenae TaxID=2894083 RepID=UPI001E42B957|nr:glycosyl hydrolase [Pontibacter harenae]MCC9167011.1 glycoside hydrolase family 26 protein [Pontibacter harenae]